MVKFHACPCDGVTNYSLVTDSISVLSGVSHLKDSAHKQGYIPTPYLSLSETTLSYRDM